MGEQALIEGTIAVAADEVDHGHRLVRGAPEGWVAQGPRERERLLAALLGGGQFAAQPSEVGRDPEESSQQRMLHLADKAERLVDEAHQVDPQAVEA